MMIKRMFGDRYKSRELIMNELDKVYIVINNNHELADNLYDSMVSNYSEKIDGVFSSKAKAEKRKKELEAEHLAWINSLELEDVREEELDNFKETPIQIKSFKIF